MNWLKNRGFLAYARCLPRPSLIHFASNGNIIAFLEKRGWVSLNIALHSFDFHAKVNTQQKDELKIKTDYCLILHCPLLDRVQMVSFSGNLSVLILVQR